MNPNNFTDTGMIRVLVVDDHQIVRQGIVNIINNQPGIRVVGEAGNGREALDLTRQLRPDVVVMDLSIPDMDGVEVTYRIKADLPEVHVIGLSMYTEDKFIQSMLLAGAEAFVDKAAPSNELLKVIHSAVGKA